jgi:hypothetical protein
LDVVRCDHGDVGSRPVSVIFFGELRWDPTLFFAVALVKVIFGDCDNAPRVAFFMLSPLFADACINSITNL